MRIGTLCNADSDGRNAMSQYCAQGTGLAEFLFLVSAQRKVEGQVRPGPLVSSGHAVPRHSEGGCTGHDVQSSSRSSDVGSVIGGGPCLSGGVTVCAGGQAPVPDTASCPKSWVPRGRRGHMVDSLAMRKSLAFATRSGVMEGRVLRHVHCLGKRGGVWERRLRIRHTRGEAAGSV